MKKWLFSLIAVSILLVGCQEESAQPEGLPVAIEVEIQSESQFEVGQQVELAAYVSQAEEAVNDVEEVKFEVWESGFRDNGIMLDAELQKDGLYIATYEFDHDGVYYMYAHTTARGLHVMPKQEIIVGSPDLSKVTEDKGGEGMQHENHKQEENHEH